MSQACDGCLARPWLLDRLSGHLDRLRRDIGALLALDDDDLVAAAAPREREAIMRERDAFCPESARAQSEAAGLELVCRCEPVYPAGLAALAAPPAVIHVAGGRDRLHSLCECECECVAVVGARRASDYGLEVARSLGRGLGAAGVTVVSGMALGIDSAAHAGAVEVTASTIAVLPGPANRPYPAGRRRLYRSILQAGVAVSELPPGAAVRRWCFTARNRTIAALAGLTVVVEAGSGSGSLITARLAEELGRAVGAVPGRVTSPLAEGPNDLLARGAQVVRGPGDVLDQLFGAEPGRPRVDLRPPIGPLEAAVLDAIAQGSDVAAALARAGLSPEQGMAALSSLELNGRLRRGAGGRYTVIP